MRMRVRSLASFGALGIWCCHELGVGRSHGLDSVLLWLWRRPAAAALIQPLEWKPPYAAGTAKKLKKQKRPGSLPCPSLCLSLLIVILKEQTPTQCFIHARYWAQLAAALSTSGGRCHHPSFTDQETESSEREAICQGPRLGSRGTRIWTGTCLAPEPLLVFTFLKIIAYLIH